MSKPRAKRLSEEEWARYKDYISGMYKSHSASLKEILDFLHENGLNSSENQLRQQLKKWDIQKNIKADEWGRIAHLVSRRSLHGKSTFIIRSRHYYSPSKIAKETRRHCTATNMIRFNREPTPECPNHITLNTPRPMLVDITWPCTLPWLQFGRQYASLLERGSPSPAFSSPLRRVMKKLVLPVDVLQLGVFEKACRTLSASWNLNSSYLVANNLPQDTPGQVINLLAYVLSNNHAHFFFLDPEISAVQHFETLCDMLISCGLLDLEAPTSYSSNYTAAAVMENVLRLLLLHLSGENLPSLGQKSITLILWVLKSPPILFTRLLLSTIYNAMMQPLRPRYSSKYPESIDLRGWIRFIENILSYGGDAAADNLLGLMSTDDEAILLMAALNSHPPRLGLAQALLDYMPTLADVIFDILDEDHASVFAQISPLICAALTLEEPIASSAMKLIQASRRSERGTTQAETLDVMLALCYRGHNSLLDDWLRSNTDLEIDSSNTAGFTMLHAAVLGSQSSTCEKLLKLGAKVQTPKSPLAPPLYHSLEIWRENLDIPVLLAQWGARIDCRFPFPVTPHTSSVQGDTICIQSLFEETRTYYHLDVRRFTLLVALCTSLHPDEDHQNLEITTFIRQALQPTSAGMILPQIEKPGDFLHYSHMTGACSPCSVVVRDMEVVHLKLQQMAASLELVAKAGAGGEGYMVKRQKLLPPRSPRINTYDSLALLRTVQEASEDAPESLAVLLAHRPVVLTGDEHEAAAIANAAIQGSGDVLRALLRGLPPTTCNCKFAFNTIPQPWRSTREYGYTKPAALRALTMVSPLAAAALQKSPNEYIETLLNFGFRPDRDTIAVAASTGRHNLVKNLLKECTTWDTDRISSTSELMPLKVAISSHDGPMVQLLIDSGEDVNSSQYQQIAWGKSPLQLAVEEGMASIVDTLLEAGADVNQRAADVGGATALQLAAIGGYMDMAKIFLDKNADINAPGARQEHGRTALQGAAEHGRLDMVALLLSFGAQTQGLYRQPLVAAVALARRRLHWVMEEMLRERCGWLPEDEAALELLVSRRRWFAFKLDDSEDGPVNSPCLGSESDDQIRNHHDTAATQEDGWENEPLCMDDPDTRFEMTFPQESFGHAAEDIAEDDNLRFPESDADVPSQDVLPEANLDVLNSDALGSVDMGAVQDGSMWPSFDTNGWGGAMADSYQHSFLDDDTWAEAAAPFMNDGFWYGPPI